MKHVAGLDGLRAVAVTVVVLFHAEAPFFSGGFLGVSLFFTLSGFLITTLLLSEFDGSGTVSLRSFYGRRTRRLLPAAYVCLLAVAACAAWWDAAQLRRLGGDLVASVLNVANWRFAFAPTSYQELFTTAPSPVAHFWSLAIEEQVYLVLPLIVLVALRRGRRALMATTVVLLATSVVATLVTSDRDLVYNGTHTRAAEVLIGMLLAQMLAGGAATVVASRRRVAWLPGAVACAVFAVLVVAASVDQDWIYRGGLPAVAVVSATLIWTVMRGGFPTRLLEVAPLVAVGRVSYGIYLFHWPVFLLLDSQRTGLDGVALLGLRCLVTAVATLVVYLLVEQPVRLRRVLDGPAIVPAMGATAASVVLAAVVVVPSPALTDGEQLLALGEQRVVAFGATGDGAERADVIDDGASSVDVTGDVATGSVEDDTSPADSARPDAGVPSSSSPQAAAPDTAATTTAVPAQPPVRVAVVGSDRASADALIGGLDPDVAIVIDATRPECPLSIARTATCSSIVDVVTPIVAEAPDVVVFATGIVEARDALARKRAAVTDAQIGDLGVVEEGAIADTVAAIDLATASGATVVWYTPAHTISDYFRQFQRIAVSRSGMTVLHGPAWELVEGVERAAAERTDASADAVTARVMVIGDSTSLYLAQALADGSDGRVSVLWAGANGCPVGDVVATRDSAGGQWVRANCEPYADKLPPIVADFRPDALVVMTGPTELIDQQYTDGSAGHAGDARFAAQRDAGLDRILAVVGPDLPVLVVDLPAVLPGRFTKGEMTSPDRLAAANAQVVEWAQRHPQVDVFAYRDTLEAAEAEQGRLRADGMHADPEPLEELARTVYVDQLLAQIEQLRAILRP